MRPIDADSVKRGIAELKQSPWFKCDIGHVERKEAVEIVEYLCIDKEPTIDAVEVVRCKDCKHRPIKGDGNIVYAPNDSDGWDDDTCPCLCEDCYYNWMPEDDFFCKRGERREDV